MSQLARFDSESKLLAHPEWVGRYVESGRNYPITLEVDPTNRCPLDCGYCIWKDFRYDARDSLKPEVLMRIPREAAEIGVKSIIWTGGGDPLAHPKTIEAIETSTEMGLKNGMFTSAVPMTPRASEVLLDNISWVRFHVDGATPETYGTVHRVPPQVFGKATENIRYFTKRRNEKGSNVSAGIGTVAFAENFQEAAALAKLAKSLGLDYFQYKHDLTQMKSPQYLKWWEKEVVPLMDKISDELEDSSFKIQYSKGVNYGALDESPECHVHHMNTAITADGRVAYCKSLRDVQDWSLGNVNEMSLKQIFDSEAHQQLRQQITPTNCGILPCPFKAINIRLQQIVDSGQNIPVSPSVIVPEHSNFI